MRSNSVLQVLAHGASEPAAADEPVSEESAAARAAAKKAKKLRQKAKKQQTQQQQQLEPEPGEDPQQSKVICHDTPACMQHEARLEQREGQHAAEAKSIPQEEEAQPGQAVSRTRQEQPEQPTQAAAEPCQSKSAQAVLQQAGVQRTDKACPDKPDQASSGESDQAVPSELDQASTDEPDQASSAELDQASPDAVNEAVAHQATLHRPDEATFSEPRALFPQLASQGIQPDKPSEAGHGSPAAQRQTFPSTAGPALTASSQLPDLLRCPITKVCFA